MTYRDRVAGCWAGKCLGGAAGMAFEGVPYRPRLTADRICLQNVPNDDLELQLVWLVAMERHGLALDAGDLGRAWLAHIPAGCDEYCIALRNLRHGIMPPYSGYVDNCFADGMGAAIRSEIWAALFPGQPDTAARYASYDAMVDHWGDGVYAEMFLAAAESIAFGGGAIATALREARGRIPAECRVGRTIDEVFARHDRGDLTLDDAVVWTSDHFRHANFTDCAMNLAAVVTALLWGEGDVTRTVLAAVNCGRDTDCTAATCGALLGIARGAAAMPPEWLARLDDRLALSAFVEAVPGVPLTLTDMTARTVALSRRLGRPAPPTEPLYVPCAPAPRPAVLPTARWLVTELPAHEAAALAETLRTTGRCPAEWQDRIITTGDLQVDLSAFARDANTLDLFTFLEVHNPPETVVLSVTADVGLTLWIDGVRLVNHHSRQLSIPSFHRAEGGAAFAYPVADGDRKLVHLRLYNCLPPLHGALLFGGIDNNHLECCRLTI